MKTARPIIVLVIVLATFVIISAPPPVRATAQPPFSTINIGDWWKYNLQVHSVGATLTLTETIVGSSTLVVNGVATDCYKATLTGSGTFSFSGLSGSLTESGISHFRKSDMALVNTNLTQVLTAGFVLTEIVYTNTSIPVAQYQFPLYVGKTWSASYSSTTTTTSYSTINPTPSTTKNTTQVSQNYNVASESVLSVPAGSYDAYDVHSTASSGYTDDYYSPQVENSIETTSHFSNGTVTNSLSLQDFSAWPFQSSLTVSKSGTNYGVGIYADATISNTSQNSTAITFQVNATSGTSGRADVAIPKTLNNTLVKVYVDSNLETLTATSNATSYIFYFTFGLTTHTVTLLYAAPATTTPLTTYLLYGGIAAAIAIVAVVALLALRRRSKPSEAMPTTMAPPAPAQPPGPAGNPPTSLS
jgi:hypothetical protein